MASDHASPIIDRISERGSDTYESERLARRWFAAVDEGAFDELGSLVHDDVVLISKLRPGVVVEGREAFVQFTRETVSASLYEAVTTTYHALDAQCVIVEGRMRWIDDDRVIRDDPVTWAMEFRDGRLVRFVPARTMIEAETMLGRSAS